MAALTGTPSCRRRSHLRGVVGLALDLAFPARCVGCGREGDPICDLCLPRLALRRDLPPGIPIGLPSDIPPPLLQLEWCAPFNGLVRRALHELKYGGERRLAEPLGDEMAARWRRAGRGGDIVVPVPVHPDRARERGYDQAVLLAEAAARGLELPMEPILVRRRATRAQFSLGRAARAGNVAGAFALAHAADARLIRGRRVILVDDVVTTGATLASCGEVLLASGALGVAGLTVARER